MNLFLKHFILITFFITAAACSQQTENMPACTPNVNDTGLQLSVASLGSNTYSFTLCGSVSKASVFTVYGGTDIASIQSDSINVNGAWRQKNITGISATGQSFQVTFHSSDNTFAIYQDIANGSGGYNLDSTKVLVNARALRVF
jgi:hypothetical protein